MHAECEHQAELGWLEKAKTKVNIYTFNMTTKAIVAQHKLEREILNYAKVGKAYYTKAEQQTLLSLEYMIKSHEENLPNHVHYEFKKGNMAVGVLCMDDGELSFAPLASDDKAANSQYINFSRLPDFKIVADLMVALMSKFME